MSTRAFRCLTGVLVPAGVWTVAIIAGLGAVSKLLDPRTAVESAIVALESNWLGVALVSVVAGVECAVVTALALGRLGGTRAIALGATIVALFCAWLWFLRMQLGADADCGCLTAFQRRTVSDALTANGIVLAELVVILLLARLSGQAVRRVRA